MARTEGNVLCFVFSISVVIYFLMSCSNNQSTSRKRYKEYWVESNFEGDTIFNGLTKFYDSQEKLQAAEYDCSTYITFVALSR